MRAALLVGIGCLLLGHASLARAEDNKKDSKHHHHHHKHKEKAPVASEPETPPPSQPERAAPSQLETPPVTTQANPQPKAAEAPKPSPTEAVATTGPAPAASKPATPSKESSELNFDLFAGEKKKSPEEEAKEKERLAKLEHSVKVRRKLLLSHQAFGFITLGTMAATLVIGQLQYLDKYGHGNDVGTYYRYHEGLAIATTGLFGTTGILALAAPNPYPKPVKFDAALVHKVSMAIATAGMVAQVVLGPIIATREGKLDQRDLAFAHQVTGYATFGFMTAGVLAYVF